MALRGFEALITARSAVVGIAPPAPRIVEQLESYYRLLARWNRTINLTALSLDPLSASAVDRLIIEPLFAAELLDRLGGPSSAGSRWVDVGSGGGSPAIPLRLMKPAGELVMVESRTRKTAFLREVVRELELSHTSVEAARFGELVREKGVASSADLVTTRAVRIDEAMGSAVRQALAPNGVLLVFASDSGPVVAPPSLVAGEDVPITGLPHSRLFTFSPTR